MTLQEALLALNAGEDRISVLRRIWHRSTAMAAVKDALHRAGFSPTLRLTRGRDIAAACGQLAATGA